MKLCYFDDNRFGVIENDTVRDVTSVLERLPAYRSPLPCYDPVIAHLDELLPAIREAAGKAPAKPVSTVKFLSPVANAGKVVGAPVNYRAHFDEAAADPATFAAAHVKKDPGNRLVPESKQLDRGDGSRRDASLSRSAQRP